MLIADIPGDFWGALIALMIAITGFLNWWVAKKAATEVKKAAEKAEIVAEKVQVVADKADTHSADMKTLSIQVEEVHRATNGLTEKLVEATDRAAFSRGIKDEKDRETREKG